MADANVLYRDFAYLSIIPGKPHEQLNSITTKLITLSSTSIWFNKALKISDFSNLNFNTMAEHLGIEYIEFGDDYLKARMPVDHRTHQPYGILHGGASVALAETLGSISSAMVVDHDQYMSLGVEINANHIRSVKEGFVYATCRPISLGRTIHVWDIRIEDERGKLTCISRLTVMIKKR